MAGESPRKQFGQQFSAVITSFELKKLKYMHYLTITPISRGFMANKNQWEKWGGPKGEGKISPICQESIAWNWLN